MPMKDCMAERRWERRLLCADLVQVEWTDEAGNVQKTPAILEDIAPTGACLQTEVAVPVESLVHVHRGSKTLDGRVRYCGFRDIGYYVGLKFESAQKWSERFFRPKHLTDLVGLQESTLDKPE